jgi:hypothetical protein
VPANGRAPRIGDLVQWTINGKDQFATPKHVLRIDPGPDGQLYCEVEGESCRAPLAQCTTAEPDPPPAPQEGQGSALDEALKLRDLEYWPIAVYPPGVMRPGDDQPTKGKEPIGNEWGLNRRTRRWLESTFRKYSGANVGMLFGPERAPGRLWLIDVEGDGPRAAESLVTLLGGEVIITPGWQSVRGFHIIFVADGARLLELLAAAGATESKEPGKAGVWHLPALPDLEIRVGGFKDDGTVKQVQSVVPPSPGTNGVPRTWTTGPETTVAELPGAAYAFLQAVAEVIAEERAEREAIQGEPPLEGGNGRPSGFTMRAPATTGGDQIGRYAAAALDKE